MTRFMLADLNLHLLSFVFFFFHFAPQNLFQNRCYYEMAASTLP